VQKNKSDGKYVFQIKASILIKLIASLFLLAGISNAAAVYYWFGMASGGPTSSESLVTIARGIILWGGLFVVYAGSFLVVSYGLFFCRRWVFWPAVALASIFSLKFISTIALYFIVRHEIVLVSGIVYAFLLFILFFGSMIFIIKNRKSFDK